MDRRSFLAGAVAAFGARAAELDMKALEALRADLEGRNTHGLLIQQGGKKVLEWYAPKFGPAMPHYTASMAKALVGGTSLLVAMSDGRIRPNDLASKYIPLWADDPREHKITIRHLATHTSGIEDSTIEGVTHTEEPGWKGRFWKREPDPFTPSLREASILFEPGTGYQYSNPGMAVLAYAVTASLKGAPQSDIKAVLRDRVLRPLGVPDNEWSIGYGRAYEVDGLNLYATWGGGSFTARATARLAEWMMHGGERIVPADRVSQMLRYAGMPLPDREKEPFAPASGLCWYTNFDMVWPAVPRDAFVGAGAGHQVVLAVPSLDLIVVRNGAALEDGPFWTPVYRRIFQPLMAALGDPAKLEAPPYPKSTLIRGVEFAAPSTVVRAAVDSDNWPMTWADDDAIYTSYGDGFGFEPRTTEKLSMGFARVDGPAGQFTGVNIRSKTGEAKGDGKSGPKASGMLMVDDILYMLVRNTGNSRLDWSLDHAASWTQGFRFDQGFGSPTFLNFGPNYSGALDPYVYVYSQEGASAYNIDDGVALARVHRDAIRERSAWEFFGGMKAGPIWTADIAARQPVFRYRRHCQRVDAVYIRALNRVMLLVAYGHNGGWGMFESRTPWGPWSVAFHTEYWGLGETHGYRLPSKWNSDEGRSMSLVFSGLMYNGVSYDAFCVRGMRILKDGNI